MLLSLFSLCESNIFGVKIDFGVDTGIVFPQSTTVIVLLIGGVFGGNQSLHWLLSGASSLLGG